MKQRTRELITSFIRNNYRISSAESKELDREGNVRYMLNNNIGVVEDGFLLRTWGVQTDITDRKKIEKELIETNHELDTFFYKASHDLKGPLASVMGIVNLARLENKDEDAGKLFCHDRNKCEDVSTGLCSISSNLPGHAGGQVR